jgi:hypothetical protein
MITGSTDGDPGGRLGIGSRVKVMQDSEFAPGPWPGEPTGTVLEWWTGEDHLVRDTTDGPERAWWVRFDVPQVDADGDGPYAEAEVLECSLLILE